MPSTPLNSVMPPMGVQLSKRSARFQVDPAATGAEPLVRGEVMMLDLQELVATGGAGSFGEDTSVWATAVETNNQQQSATTAPGIGETVPYILAMEDVIFDPTTADFTDGVGEFALWSPAIQAFCASAVGGDTIGAVMRAGGTTAFRRLTADDLIVAGKQKRVAVAHEVTVAGFQLTFCWFDGWNGFQGSANLAAVST